MFLDAFIASHLPPKSQETLIRKIRKDNPMSIDPTVLPGFGDRVVIVTIPDDDHVEPGIQIGDKGYVTGVIPQNGRVFVKLDKGHDIGWNYIHFAPEE